MIDRNCSIGIFDSGLGGVSVLYEAMKILPGEKYIYYGDSKNAPYGTKSKEEVIELSRKICDYFISRNVKAIIIACNTATSAAVNILRKEYDIPIIGMEPALKPAVEAFPDGNIVVMATEMTLREEKFKNLIVHYGGRNNIYKVPAPKLVELIELGDMESNDIKNEIKNLLKEIEKINCLVLGCTHYVFLKKIIEEIFHRKFDIIDGNKGTIINLKNILMEKNLLNDGNGKVEIINSSGKGQVKLSFKLLEYLKTC